jgi:outer membrane receptor protein involved in Fe transport
LATAGLALFVASPLFGQASTGKVQGRVTDAATGAPIAGAQVLVDGTTLGNLTNDQGFYFINEVPPGLQNVRAQFIGYRPFVVEGQRILAGQTTTMNFELEQAAVELEAITVEGERNPLVPRDQVASKSIVRGEIIDQLPVDNVGAVIILQPGVVQSRCITTGNQGVNTTCTTIRGSRPNEEAVVIDGVQVKAFGTGQAANLTVPPNSVEQLDVTVGAFSAEFGDAQSGVVNFVTRRGGAQWTGALELQTDQIAPDSYRTNRNILELNLGGPVVGPLSFFFAGQAIGQNGFRNNGYPTQWVEDGVDTCSGGDATNAFCSSLGLEGQPAIFDLPRTSSAAGATDFVSVAASNFVPWDNGRTRQLFWTDQTQLTTNLNYQLPRGSRITLGFTRNRFQNYGRTTNNNNSFTTAFRVDENNGLLTENNLLALSGYFVLSQSANSQLALDLRASYSSDAFRNGVTDPQWGLDNQDPFLGYSFGNVKFLVDEDQFRPLGLDVFNPSDEFINLIRSNGVVADSLQFYPGRDDLAGTQSLTGLDDNLRQNPFGWRDNFETRGFNLGTNQPPPALQVRKEERIQVRGSLDWQLGRFNRLKLGGEWVDVDLSNNTVPLFQGASVPESAKPVRLGAFLQDRFDVGDLVLEAGIRWDYLDPNVTLTRTPGYTFSVPDSLQQGFTTLKPDGTIGAKFEGDDCGGVSETNPNGACMTNFLETQTKSEFSPRLGASFPVTPTSTFRLSYGRFVQMPAFFTGTTVFSNAPGTGASVIGFLQSSNNDFGLDANTNDRFARDLELPSTRTFEFGYRQLIGAALVIDIAAYNKKQRGHLTYRKERFEDPLNPGAFNNISVASNADFTEVNGIDFKLDHAIGRLFVQGLSYSFLDARGTGSDEETYVGLLFRATSNLAAVTRQPENPPEVLLPLEQSRRHTVNWTTNLSFPVDYMQGSTLGAILSDFGVFTILRVRSGLPYTRLEPQQLLTIGPPSRSAGQSPASTVSSRETPWTVGFDVRFIKGFSIGGTWRAQFFVDWRNPFALEQRNVVFLETGNEFNTPAADAFLFNALSDSRLDGNADIDDFDIVAEGQDNNFNTFMLLRAEERFGDGNGIFTVEEQETAFGQRLEAIRGVDNVFRINNQNLRLGLRVSF